MTDIGLHGPSVALQDSRIDGDPLITSLENSLHGMAEEILMEGPLMGGFQMVLEMTTQEDQMNFVTVMKKKENYILNYKLDKVSTYGIQIVESTGVG